MPQALSYPGVYIDEIPSGVRTIVGVPTAICAFVGRTLSGPPDTPVTLNSFGDFERSHGGLNANLPISYAVRDFFLNGGGQAIIVRNYLPPVTSPPASGGLIGTARINIPYVGGGSPANSAFSFQAVNPGTWANGLVVNLSTSADPTVAAALGFTAGTELFDVTVKNGGNVVETIRNCTFTDTARRIDRLMNSVSNFLRLVERPGDPSTTPTTQLRGYGVAGSGSPVFSTTDFVVTTAGLDSLPLSLPQDYTGNSGARTGMYALEKADIFNLLVITPDQRNFDLPQGVHGTIAQYCAGRRAIFIVDAPKAWNSVATAKASLTTFGLTTTDARNAAIYFPRILQNDPLRGNQIDTFYPSGSVAGEIASTDARRGVFKAPAGIDAGLNGVRGLSIQDGIPFNLNDADNGTLNQVGINCIRTFPVIGTVLWGARTARGADQLADDYKYLPVRRLVLFIEESLYRGTKFAVFEPNDEPLWAQLRLNIGAFMQNLFRQGAFQGQSQTAAYFVKCDKDTTTQNDINLGIVNIVVGFAPLKPAEFVVIKIQQIAGPVAA